MVGRIVRAGLDDLAEGGQEIQLRLDHFAVQGQYFGVAAVDFPLPEHILDQERNDHAEDTDDRQGGEDGRAMDLKIGQGPVEEDGVFRQAGQGNREPLQRVVIVGVPVHAQQLSYTAGGMLAGQTLQQGLRGLLPMPEGAGDTAPDRS